jgi:hypothetical protein
MRKTLPGVNIQYPISRCILSKKKTIETRHYPLPNKFIAKELWLIETPGPSGNFKARAIAIITIKNCFQYETAEAFYSDYKRHKVDASSKWKWHSDARKKWGWQISKIIPLKQPITITKRKGIRYTKSLSLTFSV